MLWQWRCAPSIFIPKVVCYWKEDFYNSRCNAAKTKASGNAELWLFQIHLTSAQGLWGRIVALMWCEAAAISPKEDTFDWLLFYLLYFVLPETPVISKAFLCEAVQTHSKRHVQEPCQGVSGVVLCSLCTGRNSKSCSSEKARCWRCS